MAPSLHGRRNSDEPTCGNAHARVGVVPIRRGIELRYRRGARERRAPVSTGPAVRATGLRAGKARGAHVRRPPRGRASARLRAPTPAAWEVWTGRPPRSRCPPAAAAAGRAPGEAGPCSTAPSSANAPSWQWHVEPTVGRGPRVGAQRVGAARIEGHDVTVVRRTSHVDPATVVLPSVSVNATSVGTPTSSVVGSTSSRTAIGGPAHPWRSAPRPPPAASAPAPIRISTRRRGMGAASGSERSAMVGRSLARNDHRLQALHVRTAILVRAGADRGADRRQELVGPGRERLASKRPGAGRRDVHVEHERAA